MRVVVERTGLTSHLIRAWERRYGAVVPKRTGTNRRLYSDADVQRLCLLRKTVGGGHAISRVAGLSDSELEALALSIPLAASEAAKPVGEPAGANEYVKLALEASIALDAARLEDVLSQAEMDLGRYVLVERVVAGLLMRIGELWRTGELRPSQEHMTSAVVRQLLGRGMTAPRAADSAPAIVFATPVGHAHELGCLMALNVAHMMGWRTLYLGADLPAEEIAQAAGQIGARIVGLSLVYSVAHSQEVLGEIARLRRLLQPATILMIGGQSGSRYADEDLPNTQFVNSLADMQLKLERLR